MNTTLKKTPSKEAQVILESLQKAVTQTLEKKRRMGQYAVTWHRWRTGCGGRGRTDVEW